jgi:hypothetical protein
MIAIHCLHIVFGFAGEYYNDLFDVNGHQHGLQAAQTIGFNAPIPISFAFPIKEADGMAIGKTLFILGSDWLLRFKKAE